MKEPAQNLSMSSGNMSKLNTGTLQKGIIGPGLVNAINNYVFGHLINRPMQTMKKSTSGSTSFQIQMSLFRCRNI